MPLGMAANLPSKIEVGTSVAGVFIHVFSKKTRLVAQLTAFVAPLHSENKNKFPNLNMLNQEFQSNASPRMPNHPPCRTPPLTPLTQRSTAESSDISITNAMQCRLEVFQGCLNQIKANWTKKEFL